MHDGLKDRLYPGFHAARATTNMTRHNERRSGAASAANSCCVISVWRSELFAPVVEPALDRNVTGVDAESSRGTSRKRDESRLD
jgi:hypothetical protein